MRWFIEVSNVGSGDSDVQYCVEAKQWQAALQQARKLRGEGGPLSAFSIELLDNGYRAVDKKQNLKYTVKKAPNNAPLNDGKNGQTSAEAEAHSGAVSAKAISKGADNEHLAASAEEVAAAGRPSGPPPKPRLESPRLSSEAPASGGQGKNEVSAETGPRELQADTGAGSDSGSYRPTNPARKGPQRVAELLAAAAMKGSNKPSVPPAGSQSGAIKSVASEPVPKALGPNSDAASATAVQPHVAIIAPPRADTPSASLPLSPATAALPEPAPATAAALPEFEVIRARAEEPSKETPIAYREVALGVKPDVTKQAVEALLWARHRLVMNELAERPKGKFVQIAVFDHVFAKKPIRSPLATLMWKDWRGEPVLSFAGFDAVTPAPQQPETSETETGSLRPTSVIPVDETTGSMPPPPNDPPEARGEMALEPASTGEPAQIAVASSTTAAEALQPASSMEPSEMVAAPETGQQASVAADAGSAQAASSGAAEQRSAAPQATLSARPGRGAVKRQPSSDDLIGDLFERMHDLHFITDVVSGADFVLSVVRETLPSAFALVHVFDINTKHFVVVRQHGTNDEALLFQTPDKNVHLRRIMNSSRSTNMKGASNDSGLLDGRWKAARVTPDCLLCGPVKQGGRYLGLIELGNPAGTKPFVEVEANALDYICEQFAEFLVNRPIVLDAELILK